jgi:transcriptional regulator with XRE-family HTH domain
LTAAEAFGRVLRDLRKEAGLTQEQLGLEAGMQRNFISLMELGQKQPTITSIIRLSQALQRPAGEIVAMVENELRRSTRKKPR